MAVARPIRSGPDLPEAGEMREVTEVRRRGALVGVPRVIIPLSRVRELPIDPRVAFVLSRIDGQSSIETLVDVTGMPAGELLAVLARLVRLRAVAI